jgi:hypothetical protein
MRVIAERGGGDAEHRLSWLPPTMPMVLPADYHPVPATEASAPRNASAVRRVSSEVARIEAASGGVDGAGLADGERPDRHAGRHLTIDWAIEAFNAFD